MFPMMADEIYIICKEALTGRRSFNILGQKGCDRLHEASKDRGDDIQCVSGQHVHETCRLDYTSARRIAQDKKRSQVSATEPKIGVLRSEIPQFDFRKHCLFCEQIAKYDGKKEGIMFSQCAPCPFKPQLEKYVTTGKIDGQKQWLVE